MINLSTKKEIIQFDDFEKIELRVGKIISAEIIDKSDKLLKLVVDFGESEIDEVGVSKQKHRQVISGIRKHFEELNDLVDRLFVFVTNLEPRPIMGYMSEAMIVAGKSDAEFALMSPTVKILPGTILS